MIVCSCNVLSCGQIKGTVAADGSGPRTAGEVYDCLGCSPDCGRCAREPLSLATVYNTLRQFSEAGLLRQVSVSGPKTFFDTNVSEHHHFYNEDDETVVDIPGSEIQVSGLPVAPEGMVVSSVEVIVRLRRADGKENVAKLAGGGRA